MLVYLASISPTIASAYDSTLPPKDLFGVQQGGAFQHLPQQEIIQQLDGIKAIGASWLRLDMNWADIQAAGPTSFDWAKYDFIVAGAGARGIKVLALVGYTPAWARPAGTINKNPPTKTSDFTTFLRAAVNRYVASPYNVHHWEIWNEPNNHHFWAPTVDVVRYTQLLKQAYITIKLRDASAIVISGGTSPAADNGTDMSARTFLTTMYQNGAKGSFDAVGHHPYTFPNPPEYDPTIDGGDPNWSAWYIMDESTPSLRSVMVGKGDSGKKIWATEWGYPTGGGASSVTEAQQADFMKRGFSLFASYPWAGPLIYYKYHDECADPPTYDCWVGLTRLDYSQKPAYATYAAITSDKLAPTVSVTSPIDGAKVKAGSTVTLLATATDDVAVSSVAFYVNGTLQCADASDTYSCAWTVQNKRGVQYTVEVRAYDILGNHASSTVKVTSN